jgi:hypothetical protein
MSEQNEKSYFRIGTQTDVVRYEFTNQDTIVLRKSGMFYKAMGNSAVILKSMGVKAKIRSSFDPVVKQEILELSIHVGKIDELKKFLADRCGGILRDDTGFFIARLKQPMDAKKLRALKKSGAVKSEATESIIMKKRKETPLAKEVRDLSQEAMFLIKGMNGTDGQVLGRTIVEQIMVLQRAVRELMRDEDSTQKRQAVENAADDFQGLLLLVPNFSEHADRLARMGRSLNFIVSRVSKDV